MYISIGDCATCLHIPQKVAEDIRSGTSEIIPAEVNDLSTILELEDESTHSYCTSITRLLKCLHCGTYYYYNHYKDEGEHFMDPTCDAITVRRYDPLTVIDFLERIVAGSENVLPKTLGQMTKAFAEGTSVPATKIADVKSSDKALTACRELEELRSRYDLIVSELEGILQRPSRDWHIGMYAIETLFQHFCLREDWKSLSRTLLKHSDPIVRMATAKIVIGIGTGDAPVIDLVHVTGKLKTFLEKQVAAKVRLKELTARLMELALTDSGTTLEYDHGYGKSSYGQKDIPWMALYYLVVLADHQADLTSEVPALLGLLSADKRKIREVCWVLRTTAKRKKAARAIIEEWEKIKESKKTKLLKNDDVKELIKVCQQRLKGKRSAAS